ncbi:MAG: hypothetical protein JO360_18475 [Acidobacteria bacterium]|nr:hypothetical protein [Acidobacteriota bacterium]
MNLTRRACFASLLVMAILFSSYACHALSKFQTQASADLSGDWQGVLSVGSQQLHLILKLKKAADGGYTGTMDSPDQPGANDLKIDTIAYKDSGLRLEMLDLNAAYEGTVNRDGTEMNGHWKQGPLDLPLIFRREDKSGKANQAMMRGRVKLEPCNLPNLTQEARCGKYEVFEDRAGKSGRKIALNILVMPSTSEKPASDPVFFLAGGPGQGAATLAADNGDFLPLIRAERDIVFIDQRGTGSSNPLNCNFLGDRNDMRGYFIRQYTDEAVKACRAELEKGANLSL